MRSYRSVVAFVAVAGLLALACSSDVSGSSPGGRPGLRVDRFDAQRAWRTVERQLTYGQRPAGSPQLRRLAGRCARSCPTDASSGFPASRACGTWSAPCPAAGPGIVVGAHYDTLVKPAGFVGANNGAAGSAVVIEAARALGRVSRPPGAREVRFVLFDGEEPAAGLPEESTDFYHAGLRGSRAYTRQNRGRTAAMILLDYVGGRGLRLPREGSSTPALWAKLRTAARTVGAIRFFPDETGTTIMDDHTPFLRAGVPAVDLIDWSYPGHDLSDQLDRLSRGSLDAVGETVVELVSALRQPAR